MDNTAYIAFILEGEVREPQILRNMLSVFYNNKNRKESIILLAEQNIYMLWKCLKEDDFETDIIEIIRKQGSKESSQKLKGLTSNSFSEIFLFFDYDGHHLHSTDKITDDVLEEMLEVFDNETEHGKLYISYPMAEALRDFTSGFCSVATDCYWELNELSSYKTDSGNKSQYTDIKIYDYKLWKEILLVFAMRVSCLFGRFDVFPFEEYRKVVSPHSIYKKQCTYIQDGKVFVLSAFPEFLLDYFKKSFWTAQIESYKLKPYHCRRNL